MTTEKIVGLIGVAIAIIGGFIAIPYAGAILLIAGLVVGLSVVPEQHVRVMVSALVLNALAGAFNAIPGVGSYLALILANIGILAAGVAFMIILRNLYARLKP